MEDVVVGVDAPRAWTLWGERGIVDWAQHDGTARDVRARAATHLRAALTPYRLVGAIVEVPFLAPAGRQRPERLQSILSASESSGWWLRELADVAPLALAAPSWRADLGFPADDRDSLKRLAVDLADKACRESGQPLIRGPHGGQAVDGCESACISMVAWMRKFGITGALRLWKDTGSFGGR